MSTVKQTKLLNALITSDLVYLRNDRKKVQNSNFLKQNLNIKPKKSYTLLNVSQLLNSLKQFVRLIQFNLKHYTNFVQVISSSNINKYLIDYISTTYGDTNTFKMHSRSTLDTKLNSKMVLFVENEGIQNLNFLVQKMFNNNINSIQIINTKLYKNKFGTYKIFTKLDTYKKVLFCLLIMLIAKNNCKYKM